MGLVGACLSGDADVAASTTGITEEELFRQAEDVDSGKLRNLLSAAVAAAMYSAWRSVGSSIKPGGA